jgi:hypothetical protein
MDADKVEERTINLNTLEKRKKLSFTIFRLTTVFGSTGEAEEFSLRVFERSSHYLREEKDNEKMQQLYNNYT